MSRIALVLLIAATISASSLAAEKKSESTLEPPIAFTQQEATQLIAGRTILKNAPGNPWERYSDNSWVTAMLVPQSPAVAAGLLMDFQRHPKIFPKLKDIGITPLGESRYRIFSLVQAGIFQFRFTTLWAYRPAEQLAVFSLDESEENDFLQYKGFWKFVGQPDGKTLILYSIRTQVKDNPLSFLEDAESRRQMPKTLGDFQRALASEEIGST